MATIKDVARLANVSVGTVSRVISNTAQVKQPLCDRVNAAILELGYKPNLTACALRTKRIESIGLILPDITNPFFSQLAKHVELEATKNNLTVMLMNSLDDKELEKKHLELLLTYAPRGIIVVAASSGQDYSFEGEIPIVALDRDFKSYPRIKTDNTSAAALVADHLHSLGHRRVLYISGGSNVKISASRQSGFIDRMNELHSTEDPTIVETLEGNFNYDTGKTLGRKILSRKKRFRPTAIACGSDQIAIGVLGVSYEMDVKVPKYLSVVGFDDINISSLVTPHLTTIRQPIKDLAKYAIELLLSDIPTNEISLQATLIIRNSTSVPYKGAVKQKKV